MKNTLAALLAVWLALWNLTAPLTAAAQGAPATPPPAKQSTPPKQELPALRVSTHLVQVNAIVEDKRGELVTGLTKDDFIIFDDGQEQTIGLFSAESTGTFPEASQPLPPDTYSNRFEHRAGTPNTATVILFDSLNTRVRDQLWAHREVAKFFAKVRPTDRIALYALGSELRVLQDFTSDSTALVAALAKYGVQPLAQTESSQPATFSPVILPGTPPITNFGFPDRLSAFLSFMNQQGADFQTMNRIHATLSALEDIANHVARLPGRKNLVWVSGSFPAWLSLPALESGRLSGDSRSYAAEIEETARVLNNVNLAIYPVDARGLMGATATNPMLSSETPTWKPTRATPTKTPAAGRRGRPKSGRP
jgi:VWFA-related protein